MSSNSMTGTHFKRLWPICLALAVVAFAVYLPVLRFEWVDYDDIQYIRDNPNVSNGLSVAGVRWALTSNYLNYWQPLTWISHMIDCHLFGLNPKPHHFVNLLFHLANTVLLFLLLQRATGFVGRSACVAALFAAHPLHVESVAWLAERKGLLSAFFCLLSMLAYLRYARTRSLHAYLITAFLFALACMAKPIIVTLPVLLLLMDVWPLDRFRGQPLAANAWKVLIEKIPLFIVSGVVSAITIWASRTIGGYVTTETIPLSYRLAKVPMSYAQYLSKTLWPTNLSILNPMPTHWDMSEVALASLLIAGITVFALVQVRRRAYLAVGWLWFLFSLLPGLGLLAAGSQQLMADRFAYVAVVGIFIMVVWGIPDLLILLKVGRGVPAEPSNLPLKVLGAVAVIACAWLSAIQLQYWRNAVPLWANAIRVNERNPNNNADTLADIGQAMLNQGHPVAASNYLSRAVTAVPNFPRAQAHYARALLALSNYPGTIEHATQALNAKPKDFVTQHVLGKAYLATGNIDAALPHFSNSLRLYPQFFPEHGRLVGALAASGRTDEAIAFLQQGIKIDPRSADVHFHLASILESKKNFAGAVEHYREGLRLRPNFAGALNNFAWILATHPNATLRNGKEAVALAEKACELTRRQEPLLLGTLAAAYAEAGDFEQAVRTAQQARDLARKTGQTELAARNEQLLAVYQSGKPWREPE